MGPGDIFYVKGREWLFLYVFLILIHSCYFLGPDFLLASVKENWVWASMSNRDILPKSDRIQWVNSKAITKVFCYKWGVKIDVIGSNFHLNYITRCSFFWSPEPIASRKSIWGIRNNNRSWLIHMVDHTNYWVGGLEHFLFFHILGIIIPPDELIFFRGVGQPPTRLYCMVYLR